LTSSKLTAIEQALWASGKLDRDRQAAVDRLCRGKGVPPVPGKAITIDPAAYVLTVGSPYMPMAARQIALPHPPGSYRPAQDSRQRVIALFSPDGHPAGDTVADDVPGLMVSGGYAFRQLDDALTTNLVAFGHAAYTFSRADTDSAWGPIDLVTSPSGDAAFVVDRRLGVIHQVDLRTGDLRRTLQVRVPGWMTVMPAAAAAGRLLVADPSPGDHFLFDLRSGDPLPFPHDLGVIGNLVATPDDQRFCVLTTSPWFGIQVLDAGTLAPIGQIPLVGEPFSGRGATLDPFAVSPDGKSLLALSAYDEPVRHTPIVSVIDLETGQTRHRLRLSPAHRPAALAFAVQNPFFRGAIAVEEALIELGYVTLAELLDLMGHFETEAPLPPSVQAQVAAPPALTAIAGDRKQWRRNDEVPAPPLDIPQSVEGMIAEAVQRACAEIGEAGISENAVAMTRIRGAAGEARLLLQIQNATEIVLPDLTISGTFRLLITREQVMEWLQVLARQAEALQEAETEFLHALTALPEACPDCQTPLFGAYTCPDCHLDVIQAIQERALKTSLVHEAPVAATLPERLFLPPGHVLLADTPRSRIVELDATGAIIWELRPDARDETLQQLLQGPSDALRLGNGHTLILDRAGRRLFEITDQGQPYWEWPESAGALIEPVRVARSGWGDTLVVDRKAHTVRRVDAAGRTLIPYGSGTAGIGPGDLCFPTDVQILPNEHQIITDSGNHRVIEIAYGQLRWQFGNPDNAFRGCAGSGPKHLNAPRRAFRLPNRRTMILDSGNHRIIAVDEFGILRWEYDTTQAPPDVVMTDPLGMARLDAGHLAYWDERCIVQIDSEGLIVWAALLETLDTNTRLVDGEEAEGQQRLWQVRRLADDDPDRLALEAARKAEAAAARAARNALLDGRRDECIRILKAEAARRMKDLATRKVWNIDMAAVKQDCERLQAELRLLSATRLRKDKPKPAGPPIVDPQALAATADLGIGRDPLDLIVASRRSNRVAWVNRDHDVVWLWGDGELDRPYSAEAHDGKVLIADTGHHRVVDVDPISGHLLWRTDERLGLSSPRAAVPLANGLILIADSENHRLLEVSPDMDVIWEWQDPTGLGVPVSCQRLLDGNTVLADWSNHVVLEVNPAGQTVWRYGTPRHAGNEPGLLNFPEHAVRLHNGNTLIADGRNDRVIEVSPKGEIVWEHHGQGWHRLSLPTRAARQADGATVITQGSGKLVFEVARDGTLLWRANLGQDLAATRSAR
jgi:hypothetical protein